MTPKEAIEADYLKQFVEIEGPYTRISYDKNRCVYTFINNKGQFQNVAREAITRTVS